MKKILVGLCGLALTFIASAETFTVDAVHSGIGFSVKHMMVSNVKGSFNTFEGSLDYDIATKTLKSVEGTIDAASIDTNNSKRDRHLNNEDFFNTGTFSEITFKSTSVEKTGDNTFTVTGNLNVLGVDHEVVLPVTINGPVDGRRGAKLIGVESTLTINRRDIGITQSPAAAIGDEVKVEINAEATHK
ncbi:MAG: YceI family protein [Kiritimatiellales bacterium]|nr:YceI family protein [Kiritimatiellales bacterium]